MSGERTWKHGGGVGRRKNRTIQENKSEKFQFVLPRYPVSFIVVSVRPNQTQRRGKMILFINRINHYFSNSVNVARHTG